MISAPRGRLLDQFADSGNVLGLVIRAERKLKGGDSDFSHSAAP